MFNRFAKAIGQVKYSSLTEEFPDKDKYPLYYQANKHVFTIKQGEKLFIPAGWFHFVFSEDTDEDYGLNLAVNYWYYPENNWKSGELSQLLPQVTKHDIKLSPKEIFGDRILRCTRSELDKHLFPSDRLFNLYKGKVWNEYMTFDEFYEAKNPKYYIIQDGSKDLEKYAPPYTKGIYLASAWANFGNARSSMHFDEHDNWLCQLKGTKRVVMFPHEDRHLLYLFNEIDIIPMTDDYYKLLNVPMYFISHRNGLAPEFYTKYENVNGVIKNEEISDIYKKELELYENNRPLVPFPKFDHPDSFQVFWTEGANWFTYPLCKYPFIFLLVISGNGTIVFLNRRSINVTKGNVIIFPDHFTFPYHTTGNLKILTAI